MLNNLRQTVNELGDTDFGDFYQQYIVSVQDAILSHDFSIASKQYHTIEDINQLIKGLNILTEELKK